MTSQQLRFGAYWDAIPPFYSVQGLPALPSSTYQAFTNGEGLSPIEMPRDLVFKLLWQVKSVTLKLEYEFDPEQTDEWTPTVGNLTTDQPLALFTRGPYALTDGQSGIIASASWATRELKLPQGDLAFLSTAAYSTDADTARGLTREGFGIINPFVGSDYADFQTEIALAQGAIDTEAGLIQAKIQEMKSLAITGNYSALETELTRQETAFNAGVQALKQTYQERADTLIAQFEATTQNENWKVFYGRKAQELKDRAVFDVKQEARLQWFEWEQGFKQRLGFPQVSEFRIQGPVAMHTPPTCGGLFAGVFQTTDQIASASTECVAVLKVPSSTIGTNFGFTKSISYERQVWIEPGETAPSTVLVDEDLSVFIAADLPKLIATTATRAGAVKFTGTGDGRLYAGYYEYNDQSSPPSIYTDFADYSTLFNAYNETILESPRPFPTAGQFPTPEIADVVLSGPYYGGGSWDDAAAEFQPVSDKINQLKEVAAATEKGTFELRDKADQLLFSTPLFLKNGVPIKNLRLTYKIDKLYTDPA